jgi:predicted MFS family arabinose efflux permease
MARLSASYAGFAAYGLFWGTWGAALPALRQAAGIDDAALGVALVFVGAGGLPAMLLTGRAVDRFGARIAGLLLIALALAGVLMASMGRDLTSLAVGMALVGLASGAGDVAINALAGLAEQRSGRRTITVAHAVFSSFVVVGSLGSGALRAFGADAIGMFTAAGVLIAVAGAVVFRRGDTVQRAVGGAGLRRMDWRLVLPFVVVGLVGALGYAVENAHQSWSAIFLGDVLGAAPGFVAIAPATFALCAAVSRFAAGLLTAIPTSMLLIAGAIAATTGTLLLGVASTVPAALAGLAIAALGISVLAPTLLSRATRDVPADRRGRATSVVATMSYLGFVLGPVYVGVLADAAGLRGAMLGVAALAVAFGVLAPLVTRDGTRRRNAQPRHQRSAIELQREERRHSP